MPKWMIFFSLIFLLVIGTTLVLPLIERQNRESVMMNTTPSPSPFGYKALYMLMSRVQGQPVELWQHSIMNLPANQPKTLLFLEPGPGLFFNGPSYTTQMRMLVQQGYHFVFILNQHSLVHEGSSLEKPIHVLEYLNSWYGLSLRRDEKTLPAVPIATKSHFQSRQIQALQFETPKLNDKTMGGLHSLRLKKSLLSQNSLMTWEPQSAYGGRVLLMTLENEPIALTFPKGQGAVTVILNSYFFQNGQLDKADNAALAVAIAEMYPHLPIGFEVYSSGFNENKDIITYLGTGKGILFLMSSGLILLGLCFYVLTLPVKFVRTRQSSHEQQFTQETFISALSQHYLNTGKWQALYQKLLSHFYTELKQRYPAHNDEERLHLIAQSPFIEVSLKELEAVFNSKNIASDPV